jgi:hypothetical protein
VLQALVKVSLLKMHLVSQGLPYSNERGFLIDFNCVVSEWVTWALVGRGRQSEANHNCDKHGQYRDTHFRHARAVSTNVRFDMPVASGEVRVKEIKRPARDYPMSTRDPSSAEFPPALRYPLASKQITEEFRCIAELFYLNAQLVAAPYPLTTQATPPRRWRSPRTIPRCLRLAPRALAPASAGLSKRNWPQPGSSWGQ